MKFVIPGGSGQVGSVLCRALRRDGHDVVILSRSPEGESAPAVAWDGQTLGPWVEALEGADVLVNLAGYTVNCRYNARNRERIMSSRIESTRILGQALRQCGSPPHTWLQASTATIYAHRFDKANDEQSGIIGGDEEKTPGTWRFSIDVARAWEAALHNAETPRTRKVTLRSAMIMSPDRGGIFDVLLDLVRRGLGGPAAGGRQYVSWIHHEDFVRALYWLLAHTEFEGPVNLVSPNPLPQAEFMRALRNAWGIRIGLPASRWMLEVGAIFMRTETELILKSRRVVPQALLDSGFSFRHPDWPEASAALCREWRQPGFD